RPPGGKSYLHEMSDRVTADRPPVVCLQEVPAWALAAVGEWADMNAIGDRTRRGRPLGRHITSLNAGFFRSSFGGQGNVILLPHHWKVRGRQAVPLKHN